MNIRKRLFSIIIVTFILTLILALYFQKRTYEKQFSDCASIEYSKGYAQKEHDEISTPRNGAILKGTAYSYFGGGNYTNSKQEHIYLAPFIICPPHDSEYDYLLKLTESHDYDMIYLIYIQGGEDHVKLYLPCGEYDVKSLMVLLGMEKQNYLVMKHNIIDAKIHLPFIEKVVPPMDQN